MNEFTPIYPWEHVYHNDDVTITDEGVQAQGQEVESWESLLGRAANVVMSKTPGVIMNWKRGMTTHTVEAIDYDYYRVNAWGEEFILDKYQTRHFLLTNELPEA